MKKYTVLLTVIFCCLLSIHSYAQSACTGPNKIGLFMDETAYLGSQNFTVASSVPFSAYAVLLNPVNNYDVPVVEIEGYDYTLAKRREPLRPVVNIAPGGANFALRGGMMRPRVVLVQITLTMIEAAGVKTAGGMASSAILAGR